MPAARRSMPARPVLVCFAGDVWDGNPHSRHHLMRRFAAGFEVLFVEGVPMRSVAPGRPGELARLTVKLRAARGRLRTVAPGLHVLRPMPVPPATALGRAAQALTLREQLRWARRRLALGGPAIAWFSQPVAAPLLGRLDEAGSILYYQDRYDAFSHVDAPYLRRCLAALARGCDVSVATAEPLADDLRALGADPVVVPHGVDLARFAGRPAAPADLAGLERPLVGFAGLLDDNLDFDLLVAVADRLKTGTLVLVGARNTDVSVLAHPRIVLLGHRPYEEIPAYLAAFACCLIPFAVNRLTRGVNPIKLREYLAAGRPVVSVPMPEVLGYGDVVSIADGPDAYADAVVAALAPANLDPHACERRRRRVRDESWEAAAARIEPLLASLLSKR